MARTKILVTLVCENCKNEFRLQKGHYDSRTRAVGHPPKYCSQICMGAAKRLPSTLRNCEHCGVEYIYQPGTTKYGLPRNRGTRFCSKTCVGAATRAANAALDFPGFRAKRYINSDGYVQRRESGEGGRRVLEHTLVMERHLGRSLYPHENVHHKNGDRTLNTPPPNGNLELWSSSQPPGQRVEDKLAFCREFLAAYAPTPGSYKYSGIVGAVGGL
jgi:hypothetical protein